MIDTTAVAWLLARGEVRGGLLHQTEVIADDQLHAAATVPDEACPPIFYAATVTRLARRPNPQAFVTFLVSSDGATALRAAGLGAGGIIPQVETHSLAYSHLPLADGFGDPY